MPDPKERTEDAVSEGIACNHPEITRLPAPRPSRFTGRGLTLAQDKERGISVSLAGRHWAIHTGSGGETTRQPAQFYPREKDGARVVFVDMREDAEGFEQIAADFRDAFFAMGHDIVRFACAKDFNEYITCCRQ